MAIWRKSGANVPGGFMGSDARGAGGRDPQFGRGRWRRSNSARPRTIGSTGTRDLIRMRERLGALLDRRIRSIGN